MKPNNDGERNKHPRSNGVSVDKESLGVNDASTSGLDANTPATKHPILTNGNEGASQGHDGHFTGLSVVSVHHQSDNSEHIVGDDAGAKGEKVYACRTRLEIIVKGISDEKQVKDEVENADEVKDPEKSGDVPAPTVVSRKSVRRSAAAWRSMRLPRNFEKVFEDSSSSDSESDPESSDSSGSDDSLEGPRPIKKNKTTNDQVSSWAESVVAEMKPEDLDDSSPSRLEWLRQKRENNEENEYLDQIMSMVGLEQVKAHFLAVKNRVTASKGSGLGLSKLRLHLVLYGKDGTGKKSIAKLYAQFLFSIGAVSEQTYSKVSGGPPNPFWHPGLPQYGPPGRPAPVPQKDSAVVFYDMPGSGAPKPGNMNHWPPPPRIIHGPGAIHNHPNPYDMNHLMKTAEKSVLILSTRNKSYLDTIKSSEKALQELQTPLTLSDYTDDELMQLLLRMIQKKSLSVQGGFKDRSLRVLVQRVARHRESESFSNAHRLQNELAKAYQRRALRLQLEYARWFGKDSTENEPASCPLDENVNITDMPDYQTKMLTPEDILGPEPKDIRHENASWKRLQEMIGLEQVKRECGDIIDYAQINYQREVLGMEPLKIGLNRVFLGPPGVGKTTVAQLYGQMLIDLNLVSGKQVLLRNPTHLIGPYVGHSEKMTKEVLDSARGNVLIIDDAHMLYPGGKGAGHKTDVFRIAVLDTLVANLSADPEDRCVILVGYEHEMGQLFNNSNPGLQRRFPKETAMRFETYSEDELYQIMQAKADKSGLKMTEEAKDVSRQVLSRMRINPKFGNAGDVENLLYQAKIRINARIRAASSLGLESVQVDLEPGDIDPHWDRSSRAGEGRAALFDGFVGFSKIVQQFEGYQLLVDGMRLYDIDPKPHIPWAFIFKGPPGTGKTSTARKVGRMYYDMGLLSTDEVVTCSVSDLVGDHLGGTGPKVINTLETGLGKVLFIDEAYRLATGGIGTSGSFHMEAVGELVDAMTQPRYRNNMVIILAGYTAEMEFLLRTNPGLRSRFPEQIEFPPMNPQQCLQHLKNEVQKLKINIVVGKGPSDEKMKKVSGLFKKLGRTRGWASGRDVETLAKTIIGGVYMQQGKLGKKHAVESLYITADELIEALIGMLRERIGRGDDEAEE